MFSAIKNLGARTIALLIINDERVEPKPRFEEPVNPERLALQKAGEAFEAKKKRSGYEKTLCRV